MRTFAELLTEYMLRTGISDSELARTLGVRRQTIFRWREGLVDKPRYRDDVLRVAERLRLTPTERDGLLLAAGFPPEGVAASAPPPPAPTVSTPTTHPPVAKASVTAIPPATRTQRLWIGLAGILALSTVVLLSAALLLLLRSGLTATYPSAAPGETLVLIAPLSSPAIHATAPSRKLAESETTPANDISEDIRAAIEREVQAARLEHIRVATAPETLADRKAGENLRQRTGAKLVIGGTYANGKLSVWWVGAPAAARIDDLSLDALVVAPLDLSSEVDPAAPDQIQGLALFALSQLYIDRGYFAQARAALLTRPAEADPLWLAQLGYIYQIDQPPDLDQAIQFYSQTIALAPDAPTPLINRGAAFVRKNKTAEWQADLATAKSLRPDLAAAQALCWAWLLNQKPDRALPECDTAVRLDSTGRSRDARAIAYAQLGRFADAANDWQAFLEWLARQPESLRVRYGSTRAEWRQAVQAGRNPIDSATLEGLRGQ